MHALFTSPPRQRRSGKARTLLTLVVLCGFAPFGQPAEEKGEALLLLDAVKAATDAVGGYDLWINTITTIQLAPEGFEVVKRGAHEVRRPTGSRPLAPGEYRATRGLYRQVYDGGRGRIESFEPGASSARQQIVYSHDQERSWSPVNKVALVQHPDLRVLQDGADYRTAFRTVYGNVDLVRCMIHRPLRSEMVGGYSGVLADLPTSKASEIDFPRWRIAIGIDLSSGTTLPKVVEAYDTTSGREGLLFRREVIEWKRMSSGVTVPVRVKTSHYDNIKGSPTHGLVQATTELAVDMGRSRWQIRPSDELFELTFPVGVQVVDRLHKMSYVTGEPDTGKNLDKIAATSKRMHAIAPLPPSRTQDSGISRWLWVGLGVVCAVFTIWFVIRTVRRSRM